VISVQKYASEDDETAELLTLPGKSALVIGHPGHELRIHHWLETARPLTFVLTDGSGRGQQPRLLSTAKVLRDAGAKSGGIFGRWTDAQAYEILLTQNLDALIEVTNELANALVGNEIRAVVADAMEGFNPTHDLCRYITNAAALTAERRSGQAIANFAFLLVGPPNATRDRCVSLQLDDKALARKRVAAENYPELKTEIDAAISTFGLQMFAAEILCRVVSDLPETFSGKPYYEEYGENQVKEGHYQKVIRYQENVLPLIQALWRALGLGN
jgi:hypothetical protein